MQFCPRRTRHDVAAWLRFEGSLVDSLERALNGWKVPRMAGPCGRGPLRPGEGGGRECLVPGFERSEVFPEDLLHD